MECIHVCLTGSPCCTAGKKNCIGEITIKKIKNKLPPQETRKTRARKEIIKIKAEISIENIQTKS